MQFKINQSMTEKKKKKMICFQYLKDFCYLMTSNVNITKIKLQVDIL